MSDGLGRKWDEFDAYLFDIDGTLMNCTDATHYFAFLHALKMLSGRELNLDGVVAHGNVDEGILRDALTLGGVSEAEWRPRLTEATEAMGEFVAARKAELCTDVLPGVVEVLEHLRGRGAKLAVATGNLARIGQLKLERAGLWRYFDFGGWSNGHARRADVFAAALAQARELVGETGAVCVLGDTPQDIEAAHANGVPVIALATGIYPAETLRACRPEMLLGSLAELFPR